MIRTALLCLAVAPAALAPASAAAAPLDMPPGAERLFEDRRPADSTLVATGPYAGGLPGPRPEGEVSLTSWRLPGEQRSSLQILDALRAQLEAEGFEPLYSCADTACGGFDFRYALEVLPAPQMHVSLGDYRYLSAARGAEHVAILVSRTDRTAYVQVTRVGPIAARTELALSTRNPVVSPGKDTGDFAATLEGQGRIVLFDLDFGTGSAALAPGRFDSLTALAEYLADNPARRVALVGHTDTAGALPGNIDLSRRRAGSVLERLVEVHGVDPAQLEAEGMGYLAPLATNLTDAGRESNRRVEVILTSTE